MKKVKEMIVCIGTGKVCFRVRSTYNQLVEVMQSINALESNEQNGTMDYEVAHTAMIAVENELYKQIHKTCLNCEVEVAKQAVKKAEKAVLVAIRASQEPYNAVWLNVGANLGDKKLSYIAFCKLGQDACAIDEDCIAASKAIKSAQRVRNAAREVLEAKQELFNGMYPQGVELDKM